MSNINFPDLPEIGDVVYIGSYKYIYNGEVWEKEVINVNAIIQSTTNSITDELIGSAPDTLNTLDELAQAINNDASYAATITSALSNKTEDFETTITVLTTDWTGSGPYTASKTVSGVLPSDRVYIDIDLDLVNFADIGNTQSQWSLVYKGENTQNDQLTLFATAIPDIDLPVLVRWLR
jgi:hypothetical protein